jgi:hypothetical protein
MQQSGTGRLSCLLLTNAMLDHLDFFCSATLHFLFSFCSTALHFFARPSYIFL